MPPGSSTVPSCATRAAWTRSVKSGVAPKASQATTEAVAPAAMRGCPHASSDTVCCDPAITLPSASTPATRMPMRVAEAHPAHQEALAVPGHRVVDGVLRRDGEVAGAERRPVGVEHAAFDREEHAVVLPPRDQVVTAAEGDVGDELQLAVLAEVDPVEGEQVAGRRRRAPRGCAGNPRRRPESCCRRWPRPDRRRPRRASSTGRSVPRIGADDRIQHRGEAAGVDDLRGDAQLDALAGPARRHRRSPAVGVDPGAVPVEEARAARARQMQPARVARDRQPGCRRRPRSPAPRAPGRRGRLAAPETERRPRLRRDRSSTARYRRRSRAPPRRRHRRARAPCPRRTGSPRARWTPSPAPGHAASAARSASICLRTARERDAASAPDASSAARAGPVSGLTFEQRRGGADAHEALANLERVPQPAGRQSGALRSVPFVPSVAGRKRFFAATVSLRRSIGAPTRKASGRGAASSGAPRSSLSAAPTTRAQHHTRHKQSPQNIRPHDDLLPAR